MHIQIHMYKCKYVHTTYIHTYINECTRSAEPSSQE